MAILTYNFSKIQKRFNVYEKTQANFAAKVALTKLGKEFRGKNGLIAQSYLGRQGLQKFKSAVFFTLNSTFAVQRGLELDVGVKDERAITKGNPASKYLYPVIGGGSTKAYGTLFTQYLKDRNFMNKGDYPFAVRGNPLIKLNKQGRVTKATYSNTMIGLAKTRDKGVKPSGKYKSFLRPLFMFKPVPTQKGKQTFRQRVKYFSDKKVYKYWSREIKRLAKE